MGAPSTPKQKPPFWMRLIGVDANFSKTDFGITLGVFLWVTGLFVMLVACTIIQIFHPLGNSFWSGYFHVIGYGVPIIAAVVIGIWFTWGGIKDMRTFLRRLKTENVDALDDGSVRNHENLDEELPVSGDTRSPGISVPLLKENKPSTD